MMIKGHVTVAYPDGTRRRGFIMAFTKDYVHVRIEGTNVIWVGPQSDLTDRKHKE